MFPVELCSVLQYSSVELRRMTFELSRRTGYVSVEDPEDTDELRLVSSLYRPTHGEQRKNPRFPV